MASLAIMRPDLEMMRLLFLPDAIRTTTVVMGLLLLGFGLIRRRPLQGFLAAMAWIVAYEAAWQLTAYLVDGTLPGACRHIRPRASCTGRNERRW